jgi:hypothetical protein
LPTGCCIAFSDLLLCSLTLEERSCLLSQAFRVRLIVDRLAW